MKKSIRLVVLPLISLLLVTWFLLVLKVQAQDTGSTSISFGEMVGIGQVINAGHPTTRTNAYGLALGDVDGDGDLDILVGNDGAAADNTVMVWQNPLTGTAGLSATGWLSNGVGNANGHVNAVALGDLDNDGDLDAISANNAWGGAQIRIWQNDGNPFTGQWTTNVTIGTMHTAIVRALVVGDLDGDGDLDIAAASNGAYDAEVMAWRNPWNAGHGDPFSAAWTSRDVGDADIDVYCLAIGDLDQDGDLDLVGGTRAPASGEGWVIGWQNPWNTGHNDPFANDWNANTIGTTPGTDDLLDIAVGDLDRDGDLDLATAEAVGIPRSSVLRLWTNNGTPFTGTWSNAAPAAPGGPYTLTDSLGDLALVDLDHDGDLDIATSIGNVSWHISEETNEIIAWLNSGDPFSPSQWRRLDIDDIGNFGVFDLAVGDLDNDGDADIVTVNPLQTEYQVTAWANNIAPHRGDYVNAEKIIGDTAAPIYAIAGGDLDHDGDIDLVSSGMLAWANPYTATTTGWLSATLAANTNLWDAALEDLDQDGDLDIIAGGDFGLAVWQNPWNGGNTTPFGTWPVSHTITTSLRVVAVAVTDLNNDGWPDIVSVWDNGGADGDLRVWQNPHAITGVWHSNLVTNVAGIHTVIAGDLNKDGWPDLATGSGYRSTFAQEIHIWQNDHSPFAGDWHGQQVIDIGDDVNGLALADLDNDGWPDIVAGYEELTWGNMGLWRNPHTPFSAPWSVSATLSVLGRAWDIAVGDLDHDGDTDAVVVVDSTGWWQNDGDPFEGRTSPVFSGGHIESQEVLLADINKDGNLDTVVSGRVDTDCGRIAVWTALWQRIYLPVIVRNM